MSTIYRGFDIDLVKGGTYRVSLGVAVMSRGHRTEDEAMNWVDQWKRDNKK